MSNTGFPGTAVKSMSSVMDTLWRGVVVGIAYIAAMMLAGMIFGAFGLMPAADAIPQRDHSPVLA